MPPQQEAQNAKKKEGLIWMSRGVHLRAQMATATRISLSPLGTFLYTECYTLIENRCGTNPNQKMLDKPGQNISKHAPH